ncbi:MAG: protein kinase domain-containing protein [Planctomycetota bacterium]
MISVKQGDRISEYILEEPLGRGGFGEVWRARHHLWADRQVAIKIPTSSRAVRDLGNEGVIQASLDHPGIARTLGLDVGSDPPYFITEYVAGTSLRQLLLARGPLAADEARTLLDQILEILSYAHARGVVHQDIKPENILVSPDGRVKLTDFGLGQLLRGDTLELSASLRSSDLPLGGTLAYLAPEVRDQQDDVDARADLYSLGIVLFEILTGKRPAGMELPSELVAGLPSWCDEVFRGLYTRREKRLKDAETVRALLHRVAPQSPQSKPERLRVIPLEPPQRRLIAADEAQRVLGFARTELKHWVRRGKLQEVFVNGAAHYDAAEVFAFRGEHPLTAPLGNKPTRLLPNDRAHAPARGNETTVLSAERRGQRPIAATAQTAGNPKIAAQVGRPAGVFIRGVALAIDFWVVCVLAFIGARSQLPFVPIAVLPSPLLVAALYFTFTTGLSGGRTLGKLLTGLRVERMDGSPVSLLDALVRSINYIVSALPFGLGFICAAFDREKRTLHDLLCGTRVVHIPTTRPPEGQAD